MQERDKNLRSAASKNVLQPRGPAARPPASHVQAMMQAAVQPRTPAPVRQPAAHVAAAVGSRAVQPSPAAVPPRPGGAVMRPRPPVPHVQAAMKPGASRPGTNVVQRVGWLIHGDSDSESETTILTGNWSRFGDGIGTKHVRNKGESIRKPDKDTDFTAGVGDGEAIHVEAHGNYSQLGDLDAYGFARGLVARFRSILTGDRKIILHACETGHEEEGYIYARSAAQHISTMTQKKAEVTVYAPIRKTITDMKGVTRVFKAGTRDETIAAIDGYGKGRQARIEELTEAVGVGWVAFKVTKPKGKGAATVASAVVDARTLSAELLKLQSS